MKIATFNVNSVKVRLPRLLAWLESAKPDVACLQEIKCLAESFPHEAIEAAGYRAIVVGQKTYNGVAILTRGTAELVRDRLPGAPDDAQARYVEADVAHDGGIVRVASIYLPNGNPVGTEKYPYKLAWMRRLADHARGLLAEEIPVVLAGDYNVIPEPRDVHDPAAWAGDALFLPETRAVFRSFANLGFTDAVRACSQASGLYTFWDYQAGAWQKNNGIRIDHLMLSPQAADRLRGAGIDKAERALEQPSDHVPVWAELA